MKLRLSAVVFFIITLGCNDKPAHTKPGWTPDLFRPESIEFSLASINSNPIVQSTKQLLQNEGEPYEVKDSCSSKPLIPRQERIHYDC